MAEFIKKILGQLLTVGQLILCGNHRFCRWEMDYLAKCPNCQHTVLQLTRVDGEQNVSTVRYVNDVARKYFQKLKSKVLYERKYYDYSKRRGGTFYLNYNEYGVKKRCYSNLSSLKIGLEKYQSIL
jgi:hypothetical protein